MKNPHLHKTMKKSQLRQIIQEEISRVLNEQATTMKLKDITQDDLDRIFGGEAPYFPNLDDSSTKLGKIGFGLEDYKQRYSDYLDSDVVMNPSEAWFNQVNIPDMKERQDAFDKAKGAFLDRERAAGRTSGLD